MQRTLINAKLDRAGAVDGDGEQAEHGEGGADLSLGHAAHNGHIENDRWARGAEHASQKPCKKGKVPTYVKLISIGP